MTIRTGDKYDVFISHASEDKPDVVTPLASLLEARGARVWVDQQQLKLGDTLSAKIDEGLAESRFGVVILSAHFFAKPWPERELSGLVARETTFGAKVILPVWHNLTAEDVAVYSPTLAGKLAARTADGLEAVTDQIMSVLDSAATAPGQVVKATLSSPEPDLSRDPAATHDEVEALLQLRDRVGLTKLLRAERTEWERAVNATIGQAQPSSADAIRGVFEQFWPAAQRRLASILPLAIHDQNEFEADVRSLARALARMPRTHAEAWRGIPILATSAIANLAGACLIDGERYRDAAAFLAHSWADPNQQASVQLASLPAPRHPVAVAIAPTAPEGQRWLAPFWMFLLEAPAGMPWLVERYPELNDTERLAASVAALDVIRCLLAGQAGRQITAHFSLRSGEAEQFARSLIAENKRSGDLAEALGMRPERFNLQAAQAIRKCREIDWNQDLSRVAEVFEGQR